MATYSDVEEDLQAQQEQEWGQALEAQKQRDRLALTRKDQSEEFDLPDLVGMRETAAKDALAELGLKDFSYKVPTENRFFSNVVLATKPYAGEAVKPGKRIILLVGQYQRRKDEEEKDQQENKEEADAKEPGEELGERGGQSQAERAGNEIPKDVNVEESLQAAQEAAEASEAAGIGAEAAPGAGAEAASGLAGAASAAEGLASTAEAGAAAAEGAAAAGSAIAASAPIWGPIAAILAIILLVTGAGVFILVTMVSYCNAGGVGGFLANIGSKVASYTSITGGVDVCSQLSVSGANSVAQGGTSGGGGGGSSHGDEQGTRALLATYGITVNKPCVDPTKRFQDVPGGQTCVGGMLQATLNEIIGITQACDGSSADPRGNRCGVVVTGGSELGHDTGTCSHANGYKFDIDDTAAINSYIFNPANFTRVGTRSDGSPLYQDNKTHIVYAHESTHWDVVVGCA